MNGEHVCILGAIHLGWVIDLHTWMLTLDCDTLYNTHRTCYVTESSTT